MPTLTDFKKWGASGGKKRAQSLTKERRQLIARKAAVVRWLNERAAESALLEQLQEKPKRPRKRRPA